MERMDTKVSFVLKITVYGKNQNVPYCTHTKQAQFANLCRNASIQIVSFQTPSLCRTTGIRLVRYNRSSGGSTDQKKKKHVLKDPESRAISVGMVP